MSAFIHQMSADVSFPKLSATEQHSPGVRSSNADIGVGFGTSVPLPGIIDMDYIHDYRLKGYETFAILKRVLTTANNLTKLKFPFLVFGLRFFDLKQVSRNAFRHNGTPTISSLLRRAT